jgi:hypothetical protein
MAAEGIHDPVTTLRLLLVRNPAIPPDTVSLRYGPILATIRATYQFQGNDLLVEVALERCIALAGALL